MSYDLHRYDPTTHRLLLRVRHATPGAKGTVVESDIELHLTLNALDAKDRVSLLHIDLRWVRAESVPAMAEELARVLERIAHGLREGPAGAMKILQRDTEEKGT